MAPSSARNRSERWPELSPRARSALLLAAGILLTAWAGLEFLDLADDIREGDTDRFDDAVLAWVATHRSPILTTFFRSVTALGSWPVLALLTAGTCAATLLVGERRFPLTLAVTMAGTPFLTMGMKAVHGRQRPVVVPHLETVAHTSFPSGHTISSVAFFVTVALLVSAHTKRQGLRLFLVGYALLVGALVAVSRVYLGVHYPSDVAGGALLGIAWSLGCVIGDRLLRGRAP